MDAAIALSVMTGGMPWYVMVPADGAIGFGEGFATAKSDGADNNTALKIGLISGAISAGASALNAWIRSYKYDEFEYRLLSDDHLPVRSFTGIESPVYTSEIPEGASVASENGTLGHSDFGQWLSERYSAGHDGWARHLFKSSTATVLSNVPGLAAFFMTEYGGSALVVHEFADWVQ